MVSRISLSKKIMAIFLFGIISGLPLALITSTFKALLFDLQIDIRAIGLFSLVLLPYNFKFFAAPFIDSFKVPVLTDLLGRRKGWILVFGVLLSFMTFILAVSISLANLLFIGLAVFLMAVFSACLDIVVDAYRIEILDKDDQSAGVSAAIYGYRAGLLVSGAGALILADVFSWVVVYVFMSLILFALLVFSLLFAREYQVGEFKSEVVDFKSFVVKAVLEPLAEFCQRQKFYLILLFILFFKFGDAFAGSLTVPFLQDIGFTKTQIAYVVKTFGLFATLAGIFVGGYIHKKIGIIKALFVAGILQMVSNFAFIIQAKVGLDITVLYLVIFAENFSGGIGDVIFVAFLSLLCNRKFTATQYACLTSIALIARNVLTSFSGFFVAAFDWIGFFGFSILFALPSLFILFYLVKRSESFKKSFGT